ncbi:MAG: Rid family detoxifying hydrolase [Phycisphaerales bacterium]|nr:Rid family detoxifying hydrolase [Phycisphaerales bacterium]
MIRCVLIFILMSAGLAGCANQRTASVEYLNPGTVLPDGLPFSEAVRVDHTLYLSGMVGVNPGTVELVEGGIEAESHRTMENIRMTLEAHGASMDDVVKCTVMLADISEWSTFNTIYATYFNGRYPARSALGANGLALGARVEVECIAVIGND